MVEDASEFTDGLLLAAAGVLGGFAVTLAGALFGSATMLGPGLDRFGHLLPAAGFLTGALSHRASNQPWQAVGFSFVALSWVLPFADRLLVGFQGDQYVYVILAVLVLGARASCSVSSTRGR